MLTARQVDTAKPKEKAYKLADAGGLYLFVAPTGLKSWRANYLLDKKAKTRTYGRYPDVGLAQARLANAQAQADQSKPKAATETLFGEVAQQWLDLHLPKLSNRKNQIQVQNSLRLHALPALAKRPIGDIKRAELVQVVRKIADRGTVELSHRVAGRICMIFNFAQDSGLIESHAAQSLTRILPAVNKSSHMPCIDASKANDLFRDIGTYGDPLTRTALLFVAHTFVRVGELLGMRWDELIDDVWVIPESRMKMKKPHVVPITPAARALLETAREFDTGSGLVFESPIHRGRQLSENTLLFALYRLGYRGEMTVHGFRALASTVLNQNDFKPDVIERQLAHKERDAVRAAYNRAEFLPERRAMMAWWSDWILARQRGETP